jgi:GNAT superfamily N-acetyltransferase
MNTLIREAKGSDVVQILELLRITFGQVFTMNWWHWKYDQNPQDNPLLLVAANKHQIVGFRAFWPRKVEINGHIYKFHQAVDTAVHPLSRRQGIFSALIREGLKLLPTQDSFGIFNFPNPNSLPGYLKLGWKYVRKLRWAVRLLPSMKRSKIVPPVLSKELEFGRAQFTGIFPCFIRDTAYLRWRYSCHPDFTYRFWDLDLYHGQRFYAVTRQLRMKGVLCEVLIDIVAENNHERCDMNELINVVVSRIIRRQGSPFIVLQSGFRKSTGILLRHGFIPLPWFGINYVVRDVGRSTKLLSILENIFISPGDIDVF